MAVIARTLMALSMELASHEEDESAASAPASSTKSRCTKPEPQFKHAVMALGQDVAMLVADDPLRALEHFAELLEQIGKVKYYRPKNPRPSAPRVFIWPPNLWPPAVERSRNVTSSWPYRQLPQRSLIDQKSRNHAKDSVF